MSSRGITRALSVAAVLVLGSTSAWAQTFYQGVQYQYGRYGEIFYGGADGSVLGNQFVFPPEYARNRFLPASDASYPNGLASPYTPAATRTAEVMGWPSPADRPAAFHAPYSRQFPQIFSDIDPGVDVSRQGYTINDARNEAYFNVPLYQTGFPGARNGHAGNGFRKRSADCGWAKSRGKSPRTTRLGQGNAHPWQQTEIGGCPGTRSRQV